jgi:hypothetical protein
MGVVAACGGTVARALGMIIHAHCLPKHFAMQLHPSVLAISSSASPTSSGTTAKTRSTDVGSSTPPIGRRPLHGCCCRRSDDRLVWIEVPPVAVARRHCRGKSQSCPQMVGRRRLRFARGTIPLVSGWRVQFGRTNTAGGTVRHFRAEADADRRRGIRLQDHDERVEIPGPDQLCPRPPRRTCAAEPGW